MRRPVRISSDVVVSPSPRNTSCSRGLVSRAPAAVASAVENSAVESSVTGAGVDPTRAAGHSPTMILLAVASLYFDIRPS